MDRAPVRRGPAEDPGRLPAERDAGALHAGGLQLRLHAAGRHDPHAGRGEAPHGDPHPQGRQGRADAHDAHPVQRGRPGLARLHIADGAAAGEPRPRARGRPGGRLHPRDPGHSRQVRVRGRVRDEPPLRRTAQSHEGRRVHRHVGHDRLAGEARARVEREGRDPGDLLRRVPEPHAAREPAPRPQGRGPHEPDGGRLDGGRLVPPRRLPREGDEHALHPRAGGLAHRRVPLVDQHPGRLRPVHERGLGRPAREGARARAGGLLAQDRPASRLRPLVAAPGRGLDPGQAAAQGAGHAGPEPVGPGGHLRRHGGLPRPGAQGLPQRQRVSGHRPLAPRPGGGPPGRELPGRPALPDQHVALLSAPHPGPLPGPLPEGRLAPRQRRAGHGLPHGSRPLGAAAVVALRAARPAAR